MSKYVTFNNWSYITIIYIYIILCVQIYFLLYMFVQGCKCRGKYYFWKEWKNIRVFAQRTYIGIQIWQIQNNTGFWVRFFMNRKNSGFIIMYHNVYGMNIIHRYFHSLKMSLTDPLYLLPKFNLSRLEWDL